MEDVVLNRVVKYGWVVWFTGVPASGKTTIAAHLVDGLRSRGASVVALDGDELRTGLCSDLSFSDDDRDENVRRAGFVAELVARSGSIAVCTFVSPYIRSRRKVRELLPAGRFLEVFVRCPLSVCRDRDPKGLYRLQEIGEIVGLTGVDAPYESPLDPELVIDSDRMEAAHAACLVERLMVER